MRQTSATVSVCLALAGMFISIGGISAGEFKPILIGIVLLGGAVVFALLNIGSRPVIKKLGQPTDEESHELEANATR
jgi:hypothetical protein